MVGIDGVGVMPEEQNHSDDSSETLIGDSYPESSEADATDADSSANSNFDSTVVEIGDYSGSSPAEGEYSSSEPTEIHSAGSEEEYSEDFLNNMNNPSEPEPETIIPDDGPMDPLGVQRFDRTEASQLVDGPYYYDLTISGLDTAEIKDEVMKALTDKRFQWGAEDIRKKLRNGRLVFKDLNPVKAVLIVIKLQHIDVEIEWTQKLHTDPSVSGGVPGQA